MTLAQRVMVMNGGVAEQIGTPVEDSKSPPACCGEFYRQSGDEPADRPRE